MPQFPPGAASHAVNAPRAARQPTIALLTAAAALGQFAGNIYAPSLPSVARDFGVTAGEAQLTIAVFFAAFAIAQLLFGPVSDRYGRRPVMLTGIVLFLGGTALCAAAPSFELLLLGRVVQAAGAAGAIVMSRAITRDCFDGPALTRALATITIVFALVPGLTPLLGGALEQAAGWRASFVAVGLTGAVVLAAVMTRLDETLKSRSARFDFGTALRDYRAILNDRAFLAYALAAGAVMGSLAAFFAGSPALFIGVMGMSPLEYGLYPAISICGFMIGGLAARSLAGRVSPQRLAASGLLVLGAGALVMIALPLNGVFSRAGFAAGMIVHIAGLGLFLPTAIAGALQRFSDRAGSAASMQGFLQMSGAALGVVTVSALQAGSPSLAFPTAMLIFTSLAILFFALGAPSSALERTRS